MSATTEGLVFSTENRNLLQHHFNMLHLGSGITADVINERGYVSLDQRRELHDCGLSYYQSRPPQLPGLLLPLWTPDGQQALFQYRPDTPRVDTKGRPIKYETPTGAGMRLDVPPRCRSSIDDPAVPLLITEGIKKADAAASHGLCTVALLGVWNFKGKNAKGGITWLADWNYIALKDREVFIAYDSDVVTKKSVLLSLRQLTAQLKQKGAKVTVLYLPPGPNGEKVGVDDFLLTHCADELKQQCIAPDWAKSAASRDDDPRLLINPHDKDMQRVRPLVWQAVRDHNDENPELFRYARGLYRREYDEAHKPILVELTDKRLRHYLSNVARFGIYKAVEEDGVVIDKLELELVPPHVVDDLLADPDPELPVFTGFVEAPTIRPDGTILDTPGYDHQTGIIYEPSTAFTMPDIPELPTQDDAKAAVQSALEPIKEFPYKDIASCANALAFLLTAVISPAIDGPRPLALLDKPTPGTGASLLAEAVGLIANGRIPAMTGFPEDDAELEKRITTFLQDGETIVVFDNVDRPLAHQSLALLLTSTEWSGRILGKNKQARFPNRALWCATGNNLAVRGDLARRSLWLRMDAAEAQPWRTHTTYTHDPLLPWIKEHRGEIIAAVLTMARAWYVAGCPKASTPVLGKFERWCEVIGGILAYAGVEGFLGNIDELYDKVDAEAPEWEAFLRAWHTHYGSREISPTEISRDLHSVVQEATTGMLSSPAPATLMDLRECVPSELADALVNPRGSFERRLGRALAKRADRRFADDGLRLVKGGSAGRPKWVVVLQDASLRVIASFSPKSENLENNFLNSTHINNGHTPAGAVVENSQKLANSQTNSRATEIHPPIQKDVVWEPKGTDWEPVPENTATERYLCPPGLEYDLSVGGSGRRVARCAPQSPNHGDGRVEEQV